MLKRLGKACCSSTGWSDVSARLETGQVAVSSTAQALTAEGLEVRAFMLKAPATNGDPVYFGESAVTTSTGYVLSPGEVFDFRYQVISGLSLFDLQPQDIYVVGTPGDSVCWIAAGRA